MDTALVWLRTAFQEQPVYWVGIALWALGFAVYFYSAFVRVQPKVNAFGSALCWVGFVATMLPHFLEPGAFGDARLVWPQLDLADLGSTSNAISLLWVLGGIAIVASWVGLISSRAGWLGLCIGMVAVLASWTQQENDQLVILVGGVALVLILSFVSLRRGELRRRWGKPGDYETELVRLCDGSRRKANKLIREELRRSPDLSRAGAALAAVTRIRHERDPYPPPL
jgi:hypothetical protein